MYTLKDNGIVEEIACGNNFGYLLSDSKYFANTDYKEPDQRNICTMHEDAV